MSGAGGWAEEDGAYTNNAEEMRPGPLSCHHHRRCQIFSLYRLRPWLLQIMLMKGTDTMKILVSYFLSPVKMAAETLVQVRCTTFGFNFIVPCASTPSVRR